MLAELRRALPDVRALPGSAEAIPLPDASVDAVLAGNAMHNGILNVILTACGGPARTACGGPIMVETCDGVTARFGPTPACRRNSD